MTVVLICGTRHYIPEYAPVVDKILDKYDPKKDTIIHGGATGVDTMVNTSAHKRGFKVIVFKADWKAFGRSAGPKRNQQMIDYPADIVYALPYPSLNESPGTNDTVVRANKKGIQCVVM